MTTIVRCWLWQQRLLLVFALWGSVSASHAARAQTLMDALAQAYQTNPQLEGQRASLRATDEQVPQALSNYRPTAQATVNFGGQRLTGTVQTTGPGSRFASTLTPAQLSVAVTQPLYRGGRTTAAVSQAENTVQAARSNLLSAEQQVLLASATAYLDVVRDQAVLELTRNNEDVLKRQLEATRDRFRVGEVTRTDVAQAESRFAGAVAARVQADGVLESSRATYARIIGDLPGVLRQPRASFVLPSSIDEVIDLSRANNPAVVAAKFTTAAARDNINQLEGQALPTLNWNTSATRNYDSSISTPENDSIQTTLQLTVPLYQAGLITSQVRQSQQTVEQRQNDLDQARVSAVETGIRAWQALVSARAAITSQLIQVRSSEIALEGVRQEATVGARTTLDVLNAEQELLNSRVALVRSQRDEMVGAFQVLAAVGHLSARQLKLPVKYYDEDEHYQAVRNRW